MHRPYDVFISYKQTDTDNQPTRERAIAEELYQFLTSHGVHVFYSTTTLEKLGTAGYKEAIDLALDQSRVLIVVGTTIDHLNAHWVRYEWDGFYHDILNGIKPHGRLFTYIEGIAITELPRTLRQNQVFSHPHDLARLTNFVTQALGYPHEEQAGSVAVTHSHNLPLQLTSFVGREAELAEIGRLLRETRLLMLTGAGGVGKTRLALAAAEQALPDFPDGVWLVELAALAEPSLVAQSCALALNIPLDSIQTAEATLGKSLTSKQLLLVLDNCEHLLDACATLADHLLRVCPRIRILATSREALRVAGERIFRVPSLALPDIQAESANLDALMQVASVRLFLDRALVVAPGFHVTTAMAPPLAQICRQLDGIPLALELAAARVGALSLAEIAARLEDRFHLLTHGRRTALTRHQTLRAMVEWSHDLLTSSEQILLRRVSVFAGGWTLEAAEAVCAGDGLAVGDILDTLTSLVEKSLVHADHSNGGAIRYGMLETFRQYAAEQLHISGEEPTLREANVHYYACDWSHFKQGFASGEDHATFVTFAFHERDNIRAALAYGAQIQPAIALVMRLQYISLPECQMWAERLLALDNGMPSYERSQLLMLLGGVTHNPTLQLAYIDEAIDIHRQLGASLPLSQALNDATQVALCLGDYSRAQQYITANTAEARKSGDAHAIYNALHGEAALYPWTLDTATAIPYLAEALQLAQSFNDSHSVAWCLFGIAECAYLDGDLTKAHTIADECQAIFTSLFHELCPSNGLWLLGQIHLAEGDIPRARAYYLQGMTRYWEVGNQEVYHRLLMLTGVLATTAGHYQRATRLLAASERIRKVRQLPADIPIHARQFDPAVAACRAELGESSYDETWSMGYALELEDALAECRRYLETGEG